MATILIYDRHDEHRQEAKSLLEGRGDDWEILAAPSASEMFRLVAERPVDLIVAEEDVKGEENGNGRENGLLPQLRRKHVRVPVLVISDHDVNNVDALLMGAASYVPRSSMARDLVVVANRLLTLAGCRRRHARLLDGLLASEVKFRICGNDRSMIPVLCGHLVDGLEEFDLVGDSNRMQISVALEEAMVNGIVHGNLEVPSILREQDWASFEQTIEERREQTAFSHRTLTVRANYTPELAAFVVRDEGPGFDPEAVPDPTDPRFIDRPHGRGLYLIRSFVDEVRFNEAGNSITLVVRKQTSNGAALPSGSGDDRVTATAGDCDDSC